MKRTIEVSGVDTALALHDRQIVARRNGETIGRFPAEDVGLLIVDTPTATYTHGALVGLLQQGAMVVLCGPNHLPVSIVAPLEANTILAERLRAQIESSVPTRKSAWKEIVQAKIRHQADILEDAEAAAHLRRLADRVRSGDPDNVEAQAARLYWASWLGPDESFRRFREGPPPNNLLNYGYMALRASVARAVCGAGLHPALGLQHGNRYDAFALADDLMEPLRPLVDWKVRILWRQGVTELARESKQALLEILTHTCETDGQTGPLQIALERLAVSLVARLEGGEGQLRIPRIQWQSMAEGPE
ncbi:MAG: type II CRISPR-associated endonuclease Cas1 [Candidatus Sumerlaeota bacterium]|nr:type II CRISPR-associated endonuclease Cas1 [Candidatus Sumerlaeota bacterium]